jgi:hypothetical protein
MKRHLLIVCAGLLASSLSVATDLDLDASFGNNGSAIYDFNNSTGVQDVGMRSFYRCELYNAQGFCIGPQYYVAGRHYNGFSWDATVAKTDYHGTLVAGFGTGGQLTVPTSIHQINDVAFAPGAGKLYFLGEIYDPILPLHEFVVFCLDVSTGAGCTGFAAAGDMPGFRYVDFGSHNSYGARALFDPAGFLFVAGKTGAPNGYVMAVAKLNASNGELDSTFGRPTYDIISDLTSGKDVNVAAMALGNGRLYLGGDYKRAAGDYDGFVYSFGANNGAFTQEQDIAYESDNPGAPRDDVVTAVTVLANGKIAVAGYSDTAAAGQRALLLAKMDAGLFFDLGFCGAGLCVKNVQTGLTGWRDTIPSAIAERPDNRDLVIGMQAITPADSFPFTPSQKQIVHQYSASGWTLHAQRELAFIDSSGPYATQFSAGMTVDNDSVELVGSRLWSTSNGDVDITVTRLLANDSIFASQFGGPAGD